MCRNAYARRVRGGGNSVAPKPAFTLAEVLITLAIIGVVAALTLPNLIANYRNKEFAARAKRTYSLISQAIQRFQSDNESPGDVTGLFDTSKASAEVITAFSKYFDGVQLCLNASNGSCRKYNYPIIYAYPLYDEDKISKISHMSYPLIVLKDSAVIAIQQYSSCEFKSSGIQYDPDGNTIVDETGKPEIFEWTEYMCALITFDTNGTSAPNQFGADVFQLKVRQDGSFHGWSGAGWESLKNILGNGEPIYKKYTGGQPKD